MTRQTIVLAVALIAALPPTASAQALNEVRAMFDAGQYQQAIDATAASQDPRLMFLVAQSQQKLRHPDQAKASARSWRRGPDGDPWDAIGKSAVALLSSNAAGAAQEADQAVARGGPIAEAHFQRGLAMSAAADFAEKPPPRSRRRPNSTRTGRPPTSTPVSRSRRRGGRTSPPSTFKRF